MQDLTQCAFALDIIGMACDIIFRSGSCALISNTAKLKGKFAFEDCFRRLTASGNVFDQLLLTVCAHLHRWDAFVLSNHAKSKVFKR